MNWIVIIIVCLLVVFLMPLLQGLPITKTSLAKLYGVDLKTFNKWVVALCPTIKFGYWNAIKKVTYDDRVKIFLSIGAPGKVCFTKKYFIGKFNMTHAWLKKKVAKSNYEFPSATAYSSIGTFPPRQSELIEKWLVSFE